MSTEEGIQSFELRLIETIAWCTHCAPFAADDIEVTFWQSRWKKDPEPCLIPEDLAHVLRSPALQPVACLTDWGPRLSVDKSAVVEQVANDRAYRLQARGFYPTGETAAHEYRKVLGRLLAFAPGFSLADGAAENETEGFFDSHNVPAWDTWVVYVREANDSVRFYEDWKRYSTSGQEMPGWRDFAGEYLVSWVPASLQEIVDDGIAVNPESCLIWLDELDSPFTNALRARGLLNALRKQDG